MTHHQFIRLSGWGMILGALALLLTFITEAQIQRSVLRFFGALPTLFGDIASQAANQIWGLRFLLAISLITLGMLGLFVRYGERIGKAAKVALGVGILGGVAGMVSNLLWNTGYEHGRTWMNFSMAVMFGGLFVFGLIALRAKPMPHGNGLSALAGFWWPFIVVRANVYHQITGQWLNVSVSESFALFLAMSLSLAWLGYVLQADRLPERVVA